MFCEAREKMRMRITLKKKSDHGQFGIPCTVKGIEFPHALCDTGASVSILPRGNSGGIVRDLEVQIGNALVPIDFQVLDIKLNWNSSLLLGRAFLSTVGAMCNLQTNQLCLTLIDPNAHYDPIPVKTPQTISRRINDPGIIAACHCGAEYETEYSESIDAHPVTSIDSGHPKLTDAEGDKSIDTQPHQRYRKRASTDTAYYKSIDTEVNRAQEGDYSIGSWADEHHHESFAVETATYAPGADKLQDSFTDEELLNMQTRDETDQIRAEAAWERTRFSHPIYRAIRPLIDTHHHQIDRQQQCNIDRQPDPDSYAKAIDGRTLHVSREDIADILQTANGADNLFMHQRSNPEQKATKEFYDTAEKDEYGVYRDDRRHARDLDGRTIPVHNKDIRRLLERASRDEPAYIRLPENDSPFTQIKLVPEIYTKDEINEMFYGVCGEQEKNKEAFQMN
ncbi:hypothetical protein DY000_02022157 [Brassica cretica]|uniref:Peptidase A2 domain-containing protein n=1 Tax=Brassica cretica TaxID=69181 RepID=A0ABQ7EE31_BRACR|nr:hypothetical protein DY000_02022157 [Brassica cretica]